MVIASFAMAMLHLSALDMGTRQQNLKSTISDRLDDAIAPSY
jgi:hypothetical protein